MPVRGAFGLGVGLAGFPGAFPGGCEFENWFRNPVIYLGILLWGSGFVLILEIPRRVSFLKVRALEEKGTNKKLTTS